MRNIICRRTTVAYRPHTWMELRTFSPGQRVTVKGLAYTDKMSQIETDAWNDFLLVEDAQGRECAVKADCFVGGRYALRVLKKFEYNFEYNLKLQDFVATCRRMNLTIPEIESDISATFSKK